MRRLARTVLALQLAVTAAGLSGQVSASAQPSPSPSASTASTAQPSSPASSPTTAATPSSPASSSSPAASPSAPGESTPSPQPSASSTPSPGPAELSISTSSLEVVAQVGDLVHYRAVVRNDGPAALDRVFVVGFLPPEVTFVSADLLDEVEATLYQRVGDDEFITWNVGEIAAGGSITLPWTARVTSAGDMAAVSAVRAVAEGAPRTRRESTTYLATAANLGGPNPSPEPTTTRVVTYERVATGTVLGTSAGTGSGAVPDTGFPATLALAVAGLLVALGGLIWWVASPGPHRRRRLAVAVAAAALLAACTSGRDAERALPDPTGSPEVKGRRIGPGGQIRDLGEDRNGPVDEGDGGEPGDETPPDDGPTAPPELPAEPEPPTQDFTLVRNVEVVPVDSFLDRPQRLGSHDGDGVVSYQWDGSGVTGIQSSASTGGSPVRVETSLSERGGTLQAVVTITNTTPATPIVVDGRLGLALDGAATGRFTAAPSDVTLMPGGSTAASFSFDLPGGSYSSRGFFRAN